MSEQSNRTTRAPPLDRNAARVVDWWKEVKEWPAERARLRRCREPAEAAYGPSFADLVHRVQPSWDREERLLPVAVLAGIVKEHTPGVPLARAFGRPREGGRPALTDLRFRRLMRIDDSADLVTHLRRGITLLDREVDVADLAQSVYWWNDRTKQRWALEYYRALSQPTTKQQNKK